MKDLQHRPPRWASRLLAWYCKPELFEDLSGDLHEYFLRNVHDKGLNRARIIYIIDVLKFFRFYTVRKPQFLDTLIHWVMIRSYIRTSGRTIVRNKLFSAINIAGLALSMSVGLLMIAMMTDLLSYDRFHAKKDRIYRVNSQYQFNGRADHNFSATVSLNAAKAIKETFSGVEDVAILHRDFAADVTAGETTVPLSGFWSNESLLDVFSFKLLHGNAKTMLRDPFSLVLTEASAIKLFGETNVLGKIVTFNRGDTTHRDYTVTGVLEDLPRFSHIRFDMLGSLSTRNITEANNPREMAWDNVWHAWAYVLLRDPGDPSHLQENLAALSKKEDSTVPYTHIEFAVQPLTSILTGDKISNEIGPRLGSTVLWVLAALTFVVVLSACLNYTNLSIARSFRRSREIGIRKTIGALKSHVRYQFITESVILSLMSLVLAFGFFLLLKPYFLGLESSLQQLLVLELSPKLVGLSVLFAILVGVCAGIFPALHYARINVLKVLKGLSAVPLLKGVTMRKALIVFQYCISIIGITATIIIYEQYKHFVTYDLGFTTENILNIRLQGNNAEVLKARLAQLPEVNGVSMSEMIASTGSYWGTIVTNPNDPHDSVGVGYNGVDEEYLTLHDHKFISGRNFQPKGNATETEVIVNEELLKRFNIAGGDPLSAVGQELKAGGKRLTIIGVIRNFQYGRANDFSRGPVLMRYTPKDAQYLNVKILSENWPATLAKIQAVWTEVDNVHPLEAKFYSEEIEEAFQGLQASMKVGSFLAFLIMGIASIGLLGMVVYSTEIRIREVSIRKVFGASEMILLIYLSRGFILLLVLAAAIGLPITYIFFDQVLLPELSNHAPLNFVKMSIGVLAVMIVALLMIFTQTIKVAKANPAEVLKGE